MTPHTLVRSCWKIASVWFLRHGYDPCARRRTHFFLLLFLLCPFVVFAQDWQGVYQSALQHYQQEDYDSAISESWQAIALAGDNVKRQAYARQIFTASCLAMAKYDRGLAEAGKEIEGFRTIEPKGLNHIEAVRKKAQLLSGLNEFEEAAKALHDVVMFQAERSGETSADYFLAKADEADALMRAGRYVEAQQAYESSIPGLRSVPDADRDYVIALFNSANIEYTLSKNASARQKLSELITFLEETDRTTYPQYKEARKMLSTLNVTDDGDSTGFMLPGDEARKLFEKAYSLQSGNPKKALRSYRACEKILDDHRLVNNTSFSCRLNCARLLYAMGYYDECADDLAKSAADAVTLYGEKSREFGHVQILQGDLHLRDGDGKTAAVLYRQAITNLRTEKPEVWVKQVQWIAGQLISAKAGQEAMPVLRAVLEDEHYSALDTRSKIIIHQLNGRAHLEAKKPDELIAYIRRMLTDVTEVELKQTFLLLLSQAEHENGDLTASLNSALEGVAVAPEGTMAGELYYELARDYQGLGHYREAEINYHSALKYIVRAPSSEAVLPLIFNSLAAFYIQLGNYSAAEKFFLNLLSSAEGSPGFYNAVRQNLAALYQQTGRYEEAKGLLLETIRADTLMGTDHPEYAVAVQNLAAVYQKLHRLDSAQLLYESALRTVERQGGKETLSSATIVANLGAVYQEAKNFKAARAMFERALAIRKVLLPADHPDYAFSQYILANLLYRTQQPAAALPLFRAAADFYIRQIHEVFPALSDAERTAFYNRIHEVISAYERFLLENIAMEKDLPAALLDFRLQTKALLLTSSLKVRNQILHSGDASLVSDFNVWQHTKEQLAYLYSLTREEREAHSDLLAEYSQTANELEKSLSLRSDGFARVFVPQEGGWQQVRAILKPGEAALEMLRVRLPDSDSVVYAALVVRPEAAMPAVVTFPDGNFLEKRAFNRYINSIRYQLDDRLSYASFWKRLQPALAGVHTLYISPDGVYTKINCTTLYDPESQQYVIDRVKVMLVSNLLDLVTTREGMAAAPHALVVGFPDYRMDARAKITDFPPSTRDASIFSEILKKGLASLPGTETEVRKVQEVLQSAHWNVEALLGPNALEEAVKSHNSITLLHIATHGFFVEASDEEGKQIYSNDLRNLRDNILLRSGLLMAGVEKNLIDMLNGTPLTTADDGVLTAYEVMNLNLDAADLVVLSACETGVGDIRNGEGVYGLQRAFMLAGARHLMMSLWKVDDQATQQLMSRFYTEWLSGKEKMEAFHAAQIGMKQKFPQPYYWGAFVMMGR